MSEEMRKEINKFKYFLNENSEDKLNISNLINRLSDWNTDRKRRRERMKIYNRFKDGDITYEEYVNQRKELEAKYNREDNM